MSDLTLFHGWCVRMATADHRPDCPSLVKPDFSRWKLAEDGGSMRWLGPPDPGPTCDGCVSDADRVWFARLAAEVDAYTDDGPDLFGGTDE